AVRPDYRQNDHDRSGCPTWVQCVYDMCDGDEDLVAYLQCAVGYSLTGLNTEQRAGCCMGLAPTVSRHFSRRSPGSWETTRGPRPLARSTTDIAMEFRMTWPRSWGVGLSWR